jgi:hypothetical protein
MKAKPLLITALLASAVAPTFGQTAIAMATPATEGFAIETDENRDFQPDAAPAKNHIEDPANATWTQTGSMSTAREFHTATLLASGQVLVAGGDDGLALSSAELYDSERGRWRATASMGTSRDAPTATLLPSGQVLVAGGSNNGTLNSTELYDPQTRSWAATASMNVARVHHAATLLLSGEVLVAGGFNTTDGSLSSAELYDP